MKIVWVTHEAKLSGANQCMLDVINALKTQGHQSEVIITRNNELAAELTKMNTTFHVLPYYHRTGVISIKKIRQYFRNLVAIIQLTKLLRKIKPNKVVSNTITVGVGAWSAFFSSIPHIWYIHEFGKEDHGIIFPFGEAWANKMMGRLSIKVIVVSNALKNKYLKYIERNKINVLYNYPIVPNGIEKQKSSDRVFRLLILGQIAQGKRQEDAINAIKYFKEKRLNIHLSILGGIVDNEYYKSLLEIVKQNKLENYVEFKGYIAYPYQHIKNADAMLVCSKAEAFGRITVEAMMLGTVVIGANSGATKELIEHNKTGLLYECCNADDLAGKIEYLYNNSNHLRCLSNNALIYSKKYFNEKCFEATVRQVF